MSFGVLCGAVGVLVGWTLCCWLRAVQPGGKPMRDMPPGTRVALYKSPWPQREGCEGTIVGPPPGPLTYPWVGLAGWEAVVRLDHDPMSGSYEDQGWSCVIGRRNLTLL